MFIEAISNSTIDMEYSLIEKGEKISGYVRSYNQDFMNVIIVIDVVGDENTDFKIITKKIKIPIIKGSIKKVFCGCNKPAVKDVCGEYLCKNCEYEEPEDFSYLSQTPFKF